MTWQVRCSCGYESDEAFEQHFSAIQKSVQHKVSVGSTSETHDTEIFDPEDDA